MRKIYRYRFLFLIVIAAFVLINTKAYSQSIHSLSLTEVVEMLSLDSPAAKIERLNFENEILQFENYKKGFLPAVSLSLSPINLNRSIVKLQKADDGQYNYVEDYSSNSNTSMSLQQKIPFTGGTLRVNSSLNYMNEFSRSRHSFSSTPFAISYSQQLFGSARTMRMEKTIEYKKNEEKVKNYCVVLSGIQQKVLNFFMEAFLATLEKELSLSNKLATDSLHNMAKVKYQNKRITESDFKQIELQATNNDYMKENATKNHEEAIRSLITYLGLTEKSITIETPEFNLPLKIDYEVVKYYIDKNNPSALSRSIKQLEAKKSLFLAELSNKFNADINLSYGTNQFAENLIDVYSSPSRQQSVSVGVSIPISLWGINRNNARIAKNSYKSSLIDIEQVSDNFENEIRQKVNNYNHNVNLWFIAERSYQLAQEQYRLVVNEYAMGRSSAYELIASQQEQSSSMQKYYTAVRNAWDSYFKLREMTLFDFEKETELIDIFLNN